MPGVVFGLLPTSEYEKPIKMAVSFKPGGVPVRYSDATAVHNTAWVGTADQITQQLPRTNPTESWVSKLLGEMFQQQKLVTHPNGDMFSVVSTKVPANASKASGVYTQPWVEAVKRILPAMEKKRITEFQLNFPSWGELPSPEARDKTRLQMASDVAEAITTYGYNPRYHRQTAQNPILLETVLLNNLVGSQAAGTSPQAASAPVMQAVSHGRSIGKGINLARFLVDAPSNLKSPAWIASQVKPYQSEQLHVNVYDRGWIANQKMGLFLSVAQGNTPNQAPQLLEMVYTPKDGHYTKTIALVGKGIIFDTGGVNLKAGKGNDGKTYIHGMHGDMAGAAAVIGAMKAISDLNLQGVRVIGLTPLTPNLIGAAASRPHDKYVARNGKAVEISNTDAEGRLVLSDVIHYAGELYKPDLIVDIATLTGGKVAALGEQNTAAIMGNKPELVKAVEALQHELGRTGSKAVELTDAHRQWVTKDGKGKFDVYNSVAMKEGEHYNLYGDGTKYEAAKHIIHHSAQGGAFIREFLYDPQTPWVHMDMAGAEFETRPELGHDEYATGFGVKDLTTMVERVANGQLSLTV